TTAHDGGFDAVAVVPLDAREGAGPFAPQHERRTVRVELTLRQRGAHGVEAPARQAAIVSARRNQALTMIHLCLSTGLRVLGGARVDDLAVAGALRPLGAEAAAGRQRIRRVVPSTPHGEARKEDSKKNRGSSCRHVAEITAKAGPRHPSGHPPRGPQAPTLRYRTRRSQTYSRRDSS